MMVVDKVSEREKAAQCPSGGACACDRSVSYYNLTVNAENPRSEHSHAQDPVTGFHPIM
jgi:hypothetical protein